MAHRRKIAPEELIEAIKKYLNGEGSKAAISREYGISQSYFRNCIEKFKAQGATIFTIKEQNTVYAEELKMRAVKAYLNGEGSFVAIAARFGIRSKRRLQVWVKMYNSGNGFRQKMSGGSRMKEARLTNVEERVQIAKDCIANGDNYGETALKYNVSYQQVYQWVKKYKELGDAGLEDRRGRRKKDQSPRSELEKAQIEIARLKHELYLIQMERDLLKKVEEIERREAYRK